MKKLVGVIISLLIIAFITLATLKIWNIEVVAIHHIINSLATLLILGIAIVVLAIIYGFFFINSQKQYNDRSGNQAHPKL